MPRELNCYGDEREVEAEADLMQTPMDWLCLLEEEDVGSKGFHVYAGKLGPGCRDSKERVGVSCGCCCHAAS